MDYTIKADQPAFTAVGKSIRCSIKNGENNTKIPQFWQTVMIDGTFAKIKAIASKDDATRPVALGMCSDFNDEMDFTYTIAAKGTPADAVDGFTTLDVPSLTWAVFEAHGALPDSIQSLWQKIMGEFFEEGVYKHANGPEMEVYPPGNPMGADYACEVWVPVDKI